MLMSLAFDGTLKFWDMRTYREIDRLEGNNRKIHAVTLSRDGRSVALTRLGPNVHRIELWDLASNTLKVILPGHEAEIHALAFSPDGRILASAGGDQVIHFWNTETGRSVGQFGQRLGWVRSLDFSSDGRWLAYSGIFSEIYLKQINLPPDPSPKSKAS